MTAEARSLRIVFATGNPKKRREVAQALAGSGVELIGPEETGSLPEVVEDGATFALNAAKKAVESARATGQVCLADDSGLEVDHLEGAPGVLSARFAGEHGDDAANNRLLLERLEGIPAQGRGARFVCALALATPDGRVLLEIEGEARGRILESPRGDGDFGYDPLFLFTEPDHEQTDKSFAELDLDAKRAVSHRGRALVEFCQRLPAVSHPALNWASKP